MAGAGGLEPTNDWTKTSCLTDLATPQHISDKFFMNESELYNSTMSKAFTSSKQSK